MHNSKIRYAIVIGAACFLLAGAAFAKDADPQDAQVFAKFLNLHPEIYKELQDKPALATDNGYLRTHPLLATFLRNHAQIRQTLAQNNQWIRQQVRQYMQSEGKVEATNPRVDRGPGNGTDNRRPEAARPPEVPHAHPDGEKAK